jgi:hypothetical protein
MIFDIIDFRIKDKDDAKFLLKGSYFYGTEIFGRYD